MQHGAESPRDAYEAPPAVPVDRVATAVEPQDARKCTAGAAERRKSPIARLREPLGHRICDAVPGRNEHRQPPAPEQARRTGPAAPPLPPPAPTRGRPPT